MPTILIALALSIAAGPVQQSASEGTPWWMFLCGLLVAMFFVAVTTFIRERNKRR
jgi:uncharacterized membrane protein YdcZ (DUF606 family)